MNWSMGGVQLNFVMGGKCDKVKLSKASCNGIK